MQPPAKRRKGLRSPSSSETNVDRIHPSAGFPSAAPSVRLICHCAQIYPSHARRRQHSSRAKVYWPRLYGILHRIGKRRANGRRYSARIGVAAGKSIPAGAQCCLSDVQPRPGVDPLASESKPSDANPPAGSKPVRFLRCPEKSGKVPGNSGYRAVSVPCAGKSEVAGQPQLGAAGSGSATPIRLTLIALRNSRLAPANGRKSDISPSLGKNLAALGAFCSRPRRTPTLQEVRRLPLPASAQIADQPRSGGRAKFL
jgi:hypothetical protein